MNVYLARNEFLDTAREDTQKLIRLGLTHQFLPRLSGSVMLRRLVNSSQGGAGYTENAVSAALLAKF